MDPDPEVLIILLEKKLDFLSTIADVSMLWWVSSTLLGAAILAGFWSERRAILEERNFVFHGLFSLISIFFLSTIIYGLWTIRTITILRREILTILRQLNYVNAPLFEYEGIFWAVVIGTTSFLILLSAWVFLWIITFKQRKRESKSNDEEE